MNQVLDGGTVTNWAGIILLIVGILLIPVVRIVWTRRPSIPVTDIDAVKAAIPSSLCLTAFTIAIITSFAGPLLAHPEEVIPEVYTNAKLTDQNAFITQEGKVCLYDIERSAKVFFISYEYKVNITCSK